MKTSKNLKADYSDRYVFISYARTQKNIALAIQKRLESYHYPAKLVAPEYMPVHPRYLRRVFVDTEDLPTYTEDYQEDLRQELRAARYLIVLCSEESAKSQWVDWEINTFLSEGHDESCILPVAIGDCQDCHIPASLKNILAHRNVPVWDASVRPTHASNETAIFRIIEFLIKVDGHILNNRYVQQQRKRLYRYTAVCVAVLLALSASLFYGYEKEKNRRISEQYRVEFEKEVFPYSLVYSYCKNFLFRLPSITVGATQAVCIDPKGKDDASAESGSESSRACVLKPAEKCIIIIAMPEHYGELSNSEDVKKVRVKEDAASLGWTSHGRVFKGDSLHRSASTLLLDNETLGIRSSDPEYTKVRVFADMASTVNSIKWVVDYLTGDGNPFYGTSQETKNALALDYVAKFEKCVYDEASKTSLKVPSKEQEVQLDDVCEIHFVKNKEDLTRVLSNIKP